MLLHHLTIRKKQEHFSMTDYCISNELQDKVYLGVTKNMLKIVDNSKVRRK